MNKIPNYKVEQERTNGTDNHNEVDSNAAFFASDEALKITQNLNSLNKRQTAPPPARTAPTSSRPIPPRTVPPRTSQSRPTPPNRPLNSTQNFDARKVVSNTPPKPRMNNPDIKKHFGSGQNGAQNTSLNGTRKGVQNSIPRSAPPIRPTVNPAPIAKPNVRPITKSAASKPTDKIAAKNTVSAKQTPQSQQSLKKRAQAKRIKRKREQVRTFSHIFASVLLVLFIVSVSALFSQYLVRGFLDFTGITIKEEFHVRVTIPKGATTEEIAKILHKNKIIDMPGLFTTVSKMTDKDNKYLGGSFSVASTMSYSQIMSTLQTISRSSETVMLNIPEGLTAMEIGQILENHSVCRADDFIKFYREKPDMFKFRFELRVSENPLRLNQMEGFLFPETYEFYVINGLEDNPDMNTSKYAQEAAQTIYSHFNSQITNEMYRKMADKGFTLDTFITVASMVQWEAATYEDMRLVASVFINRLYNAETFPKMESDVTAKYANQSIKPYRTSANAAEIDKKITAYDTYLSDGLPPGPVCNPGMDAMLAVLDAPPTDYFYFCANIETGEIFYAVTLEGHIENLVKAGIDPNTVIS